MGTKMRIVRAPTEASASAWVRENGSPEITVEAEYGSVVIEGGLYTAAHHVESYSARPAPCNDPEIPEVKEGTILVSHLDLDTVGGCCRALGFTHLFHERLRGFWRLAEFVDLNGPHKLGQSDAPENLRLKLHAYWAWAQSVRTDPRFDYPRDAVSDCTDYVQEAAMVLARILREEDPRLLAAGEDHRKQAEEYNSASFVEIKDEVIVRISHGGGFVNHLYATPSGEVGAAVVSFNVANGAVTVSLESPIEGVSCKEIVQALWGELAGGHAGIAGSPREKRMGLEDLLRARDAVAKAIRDAR